MFETEWREQDRRNGVLILNSLTITNNKNEQVNGNDGGNIEVVADIYTIPYVFFSIYHDTNHLSCIVARTFIRSFIWRHFLFQQLHWFLLSPELFQIVPFTLWRWKREREKKREKHQTNNRRFCFYDLLFLCIWTRANTNEKPLKAKTHTYTRAAFFVRCRSFCAIGYNFQWKVCCAFCAPVTAHDILIWC